MADDSQIARDVEIPDGTKPPPAPSVMGGARQQWQVTVPYSTAALTLGVTPTSDLGASLTTQGNVLVDCALSMMTQSAAGMMHQTNGPWVLLADGGINTATPGQMEMIAKGGVSVYSGREQHAGQTGKGAPAQPGALGADAMANTEDEVAHSLIPLGAVKAATDLHIGAVIFKAKLGAISSADGKLATAQAVGGLLAPLGMMTGGLKSLAEVTSAGAHAASKSIDPALDKASEMAGGTAGGVAATITGTDRATLAKELGAQGAVRQGTKTMLERLAPSAQHAADYLDKVKDYMSPTKLPKLLAKGHEPSPNPFEPWPVSGAVFLVKAKDGIKMITPRDMVGVAKKNIILHASGKMYCRAWKAIEHHSMKLFSFALNSAEIRAMVDLFITCYKNTEIRGRALVLVESNNEMKIKAGTKLSIKSPNMEIKPEKDYKLLGQDLYVEADSSIYKTRIFTGDVKNANVEIKDRLKIHGGGTAFVGIPISVDAKSLFQKDVDIRANLSVSCSQIKLSGSRIWIG